jgi:hypothetical protein
MQKHSFYYTLVNDKKLYEVTGDEKWRKLTEAFWKNAVIA